MSRRLVANCDLCNKEISDSPNSTSYILKKRHGLFKYEEMDICSECMKYIIGYIGFSHQSSIPPMNGNAAQSD